MFAGRFAARRSCARALALGVLAYAAASSPVTPARAELPALVDRAVFFGNPVQAAAEISPDGAMLSYLAPSAEGVLNVWVKKLGDTAGRMVTRDEKRGIRIHFWAEDGRHLLYLQDVDGNENWHVYRVGLEDGVVKDLTPHEGVRAQGIMLDRQHPDQMLVGLNLRDKRVFDVYRVDLATGEMKLDTQNPGDVLGWSADPQFVIRAALASNPQDGSTILRVRDAANQPWRDLITWPFGENGSFVDFAADGKSGYVVSSTGSDVTRLLRVDLADGAGRDTLAWDPRCDVGQVVVQRDRHVVQAVGFDYLRNEWKILDPSVKDDFAALAQLGDGEFQIVSRDRSDRLWVVAFQVSDGPTSTYLYDRDKRRTELLFVDRPALQEAQLATMEPVVIPSRDGLELVSYLTKPVGIPARTLPMVLLVHGGPWARDGWGYDGMAQWLANRGYAVLQVNFRASTGFGKGFLNAGNREWGQAMQNDLTDAVNWAVAQTIADPKRVAIMGGSYGGYATLAGLAFTPELYACGVDIVGPSNLKTLLEATPPYWATFRKTLYLRMGEVDRDSVFNRKVSPLFHVDQIVRPLLIGQGLNDPRVNVRESDQIVAAMRARKLPVEYVVYTDEGHGFARPQNRLDFYGRAEEFLAKYLGGRAQPYATVEGAAAEVR